MKTALRRLLALAPAFLLLCALTVASTLGTRSAAPPSPASEETVVLNVRLRVYHCAECELVRSCGSDCVTVTLSEARKRGALPCSSCGGTCLARRSPPGPAR